jgi:hypothetical protein
MKNLGDLLVLFDPDVQPPVGRLGNSEWQRLAEKQAIWAQGPVPDWKGFPFHRIDLPNWQVYVLGEAPNPDSWLPEALPDAQELSQMIMSWTGSYLVFAWSREERTWHAWTDRFGTLHAYYAWDGRRAALGTFSPAVAAVASNRTLDWEALAGWFAFGFFPANRTHYTDLCILRPSMHYKFAEDGWLLSQERTWQWCYQPDPKRSYNDTVEEFGGIFEKVMRDALAEGRVALPVSGGLDSRSTVAAVSRELAESGRAWAYSYGYTGDSVETHIASQVARARGLPFQSYTISPYLFDEMERLLAYTEGFQDITQARQMSVRDEIGSHADSLIAALWGDVWLDDMGLVNRSYASHDEVYGHTLRKIRKQDAWLFANVALPQLHMADAEPLLQHFIRAEYQNLEQIPDPDFRVKAYKTEQWSFRWSLPPTRIFQSAAWPRRIFYDTRLADFFLTVPGSFLSERKLQIDYLKRFAPDLAAVTWQATDANLYRYGGFDLWQLPRRILKKISRTVRRQAVIQRNWEVQFMHREGRAGLECWLTRSGLKLHEFVPVPKIKTLIEDLYREQGSSQAYPLSMLMTFSAWLETYG